MPELPEVETVRRGMAPVLEGHVIAEARAYVPKLRFDIPADFSERLTGNRVARLSRRSKYILIECEDGLIAILHLGMSGRISIIPAGDPRPERGKHDHITLTTDAGDLVIFSDPRRFGMLVFTSVSEADAHSLLASIGPEPLGNGFDSTYLWHALKGRRTPVKSALLDQKLVAGLGNIYVCEALWRAGIRPTRRSDKVRRREAEALVPIIRDVLTEAIAAGGSTLKDYAQASGELGYFQHNFKAYGREGEACLSPGCRASIKRIVQSNRSSFYCPTCQS